MSKRIAFVFPGQGSQHIGMLKELSEKFSLVQEFFANASDELHYDVWQLVQQGPEETLNQTQFTQPALLTAGVAIWHVWLEMQGTIPQFLAGHSLGEYTALVCAGAIDFSTAVKLVADRGQFMQEAVPEGGAMAAIIGLDAESVQYVCKEASSINAIVTPANYNSLNQIVIAGHTHAVEKAIVLANKKGAKLAKRLPVSVPSHCSLMKSAALKLAEKLKNITFKKAAIPVINNVDVAMYQSSEQIADSLKRQLYHPVRWIEIIQYFDRQGIEIILESGPGKVLTNLNKRILDKMLGLAIIDPESLQEALTRTGVEVCC